MMSEGISLEGFEGHLFASEREPDIVPLDDSTFRVALLGDWSGRTNRGLFASGAELEHWRPRLVDRDNLDELMAQLGVKLNIPLPHASDLVLEFNELDDFHPDKVFEQGEAFQTLRDFRARLSNPRTFAQAATEVRRKLSMPDDTPPVSQPESKESELPARTGSSLLDQILDTASSKLEMNLAPPKATVQPDLQSFVQKLVAPYLLPDDQEQDSLISAVDKAIGELMRTVMHHPDFQALESAWRALHFLASRLDTGIDLKLYLLDISRDELKTALMENREVESSGFYKLMVKGSVKSFGEDGWSILAGNYYFGATPEDAELLKRLSVVATDSGAPFVAGGLASLVGCNSLDATPDPEDWKESPGAERERAWSELRNAASAKYVGLLLPRFLLRMPYGTNTEPTEAFNFEELAEDKDDHSSYLWGNPVFALVLVLGQSFLQSGWQMGSHDIQEIDDLPIHVATADGETQIKPCAEILMTVQGAKQIIEHGLMPLITLRDTGAIRLGMVQSIASPQTSLAGKWMT